MRYAFLFALFLLSISVPSYAEQYLCIPDHATGFRYNKTSKTWVSTTFKSDHKYIITESGKGADSFKVVKVGDTIPTCTCEKGFDGYGFIFCAGFLGSSEFRFNKMNGRYIFFHLMGYYNVRPELGLTDEDSDTPYVEIGKCSPF